MRGMRLRRKVIWLPVSYPAASNPPSPISRSKQEEREDIDEAKHTPVHLRTDTATKTVPCWLQKLQTQA